MFPNGFSGNGYWGPENLVLGTALFDWRGHYNNLPEEVQAYLTEHEGEIRSGEDVERLIEMYDLKK